VAADRERTTDEQGISMRTIRTVLICSGVIAHLAMAHASATEPDAAMKVARAEAQAAAGQPADASASAASDKPKRSEARSRARAMRTSGADLRYCLDRKSNYAIIRCAEGIE